MRTLTTCWPDSSRQIIYERDWMSAALETPLQSAISRIIISVTLGPRGRLVNCAGNGCPNCQTDEGDGEDEDALQMWLFVSHASVNSDPDIRGIRGAVRIISWVRRKTSDYLWISKEIMNSSICLSKVKGDSVIVLVYTNTKGWIRSCFSFTTAQSSPLRASGCPLSLCRLTT